MTTIGIFGFGAFGQLAARALAPDVTLRCHDPARPDLDTLPQTSAADILLLCVPLPRLPGLLAALAPHLRPGQTVIDCCSVKEEPARLMTTLLPPGVAVLASHPMFGPQSAAAGLAGLQIVLCPQRGEWRRIAAWLRLRHRLRVIVTSAEAHDRQAALTQGLTHLLARALDSLGPVPRIRTRSYDLMDAALSLVRADSADLFDTVTRANPHVATARDRLIRALSGDPAPRDTAPDTAGNAAPSPALAQSVHPQTRLT